MSTSTEGKTLADLAGEAYEQFTTTKRPGEDEPIVVLKDKRPEWVYDLVYSAHYGWSDFLPDDYRYTATRDALAFIHDNDADEDSAHEFADSHVDTYTNERLKWLSSNLNRSSYVEEARGEGLIGPDDEITEQIGGGQYMELREVFGLVLDALKDRLSTGEIDDEGGWGNLGAY